MRPALVIRHRMNLIHNHCFHIAENRAAALGGQQNVERLRRGDQNVRRPLEHRTTFMHESVARAHRRANFRHQQAALAGHLQNLA